MTLDKHSAPGPAAGYTFQFERAVYWLAKSPSGFCIGIETADDVAIKGDDGSLLLEQDKHSIQENAEPYGDRSKDLWNTLATWLEALDSGELNPKKSRFMMVTNKTLPECIAKKISRASSAEEVLACISDLNKAAIDPPGGIKKFVTIVLNPKSAANLQALITNCEVLDESEGSSGPKLREATIAEFQLPEWCADKANSITNELLGWLQQEILTLWQKKESAWISRDHFVNQLHAILDLRNRQIKRERAANLIPVYDEQLGQEKGSPYVKQIYLVTDDDSIVENSIREFIRCGIEKSRLSAEGNITDQDWISFEETLRVRWAKISSRGIRMGRNKPEEDVGFQIFTDTTEDYREKLAGTDTEQVYLTAGTYHRMANLLKVGWHPLFKKLMVEKDG